MIVEAMLLVRRIIVEDYAEIADVAGALHPRWFTESALKEIEHDVRTQHGYVAVDDEKVVGFALFMACENEETAELTWIGVKPAHHRKGIGRALVNAIETELRREGFHALRVDTVAATVDYEPYAWTRSFYHAIGFSDISIQTKGYPSGDDKLLLRKQLLEDPERNP